MIGRLGVAFYVGMTPRSSNLLWFDVLELHFTLEWCIGVTFCCDLTCWSCILRCNDAFIAQMLCNMTSWSWILRWNDPLELNFGVFWHLGIAFYVGMIPWSTNLMWFDVWSCISRWNNVLTLNFAVIWRVIVVFYVGMTHCRSILLWFDVFELYFTLEWCL